MTRPRAADDDLVGEPAGRYGLRLLSMAGGLGAAAVVFATLTFNVIEDGPLLAVDGSIADSLNAWVHDRRWVLRLLEAVSLLGRPVVLAIVVAIVAGWVARAGRWRPAVFLAATTASGAVLGTMVKLLVDRPRPVVDHPVATAFGKSFPSGHAMHATIAYGAICLVVMPLLSERGRRVALTATVGAIAAIGSSRLLLGVHFLTDVIGGYLLAAVWLTLGAAAFRTWLRDDPDAGHRSSDQIATIGGTDQGVGGSARAYGRGERDSAIPRRRQWNG